MLTNRKEVYAEIKDDKDSAAGDMGKEALRVECRSNT